MSDKAPFTLADAAKKLCALDHSDTRRRDWLSSITCVAALLHRNPSELPANIAELRKQLAPIHPVQAGISPKRLANIKADVAAALRAVFRVDAAPAPKLLRSTEWARTIKALERPWQRHNLARLADFCSTIGVAPSQVTDDTLARFRGALADGSLAKTPDRTTKRIAQTWNGVVKRLGLPFNLLAIPHAPRYLAIPLSQFPASFQADVKAYLARLTQIDIFAEEGPKKALRPTSLRNVQANVRQFASALVARGRPIETITSLGRLVEYEMFKEGLRFFLDRNNGQPTTWLWGMAGALMSIARYHVKLPEPEIKALSTIRGRLKLDTDRVTEKNRTRLAQFDDLYNVELLLLLPSRLAEGALKRNPGSAHAALDVMHAVAIEILLACPMRMNNLAALDIERHLNWRGAGNSQTVSIYVPAAETKNGVAIEVDFHRDTTALIRLYLKSYRALVSTAPGDWLFPDATGGGHRGPDQLSPELKDTIWRETGLVVNGHLFRHLAGKLFLDRRPGGHETVRQFLRHKKSDTTTTFYTGLASKRASQHYYDVVLADRRQTGRDK